MYKVNLKFAEKLLGLTSLAKIRKQVHINVGPRILSYSPANLMTISTDILNFSGSDISHRATEACCRPVFHFHALSYGNSAASALEPCRSCVIAYAEGGGRAIF
jgi:hypothetical protein